MNQPSHLHSFGEFQVGDTAVFGELKIDDGNTNLRLHSHKYLKLDEIGDRYVTGELPDKRKVSLIDCLIPGVPGSRFSGTETSYFADIFPHFVVIGTTHIDPTANSVSAIYWHLPDLRSAFYDFDSFVSSLNPDRFIRALVADHEQAIGRKIPIGPSPEVHFFAGRLEIFSCDIGFGTFSVGNRIQRNVGGPQGVWMKNRLVAAIHFHQPFTFRNAISEAYNLSNFISLVIGRPQDVEGISVEVDATKDRHLPLRVYPSFPVRYEKPHGILEPGPADTLLDGLGRSDEFASVLQHWVATNEEMATPRIRLWDSFKKQNYYDADRIIAAANLFDTIPSCYFPKKVELSEDLLEAAEKAKQLFKPLPRSLGRETVLRELSQLSQPRLRSKVKHWAAELMIQHGDEYPDLEFVIERAVKCRNFYVHGGKAEFDYEKETNLFVFLTRSLEFCYIIPAFLRSGWSLSKWRQRSGGFHPFGEFTLHYDVGLKRLRELV